MPNYTKHGKILAPITPEQFAEAVERLPERYRAYAILVYYTGIRVSEALRLTKESFRLEGDKLYVEIGIRLKTVRHHKDGTVTKGKKTPPLPLDTTQPFMPLLVDRVTKTKKGKRAFDFTRWTAWHHISKAGLGYNHLARLTAITFFLGAGYSIAHIVNWFGISVQTVNSYIGVLDMQEMGSVRR